jgi:hypothetical protein
MLRTEIAIGERICARKLQIARLRGSSTHFLFALNLLPRSLLDYLSPCAISKEKLNQHSRSRSQKPPTLSQKKKSPRPNKIPLHCPSSQTVTLSCPTRNHKGLDPASMKIATQWDSSEDFSKILI